MFMLLTKNYYNNKFTKSNNVIKNKNKNVIKKYQMVFNLFLLIFT